MNDFFPRLNLLALLLITGYSVISCSTLAKISEQTDNTVELVQHTSELDLDTPSNSNTTTTNNLTSANHSVIVPRSIYQQASAGEPIAANTYGNADLGNSPLTTSGYQPQRLTSYQDKTVKIIKLHYNYPVIVALNQINALQFPFKSLQIDTVNKIKLIARGNTLMLAPNQTTPFTLLVSNKDNPEQQVTLTIIPNAIPSVSYNFIAPELLQDQTLLGKANLTYNELVNNVSHLLRQLAQKVFTNSHVGYALTSHYAIDNFKFKPQTPLANTSDLGLVNISNRSIDYKYPLVTCNTQSFKVLTLKTYQPTNFFFNGIRLRYIKLKNQSGFTIKYQPQACLQTNVIGATLLSGQPLIYPGQTLSLVIAEKIDY